MSGNGALKIVPIENEETSAEAALEKSPHHIDVVNEIKQLDKKLAVLWKLEKLDRLQYLAELQRLDKLGSLDNLKSLEDLDKLDNLEHLKDLKDLDQLQELKKLDKLHHLMRLKNLNKLEELQALDHLKDLNKLDKLKDLDKLSSLSKLDALKQIEKLEVLNKIEELRVFMRDHAEELGRLDQLQYLNKLSELKKLQSLEGLDHLKKLDHLSDLSALKDLKELGKLDKLQRLSELGQLEKLENLTGLEKLNKLDDLRHLDKLDKMQDLSKLEYLKESKIQTALQGLDKLNFFELNHKKFFFKLFTSIFFDVIKIGLVASLMFFVFTKNISRQTFDRLVPYLGFGEADRVNLALSILSKDLTSKDFDVHFVNLQGRVKREVASVFDPKVPKTLNDYRTLENLSAYNYVQENYDLSAFTRAEVKEWLGKTHKKYVDSYAYDLEKFQAQPEMQDDVTRFTKASIFLKQEKYMDAWAELDHIKNATAFASLGAAKSYTFYMAFVASPKELKLYLEK